MALKNSAQQYGSLAQLLHWLIFLLLLGLVLLGFILGHMDKGPLKTDWVDTHKVTGMLVLGLIVMRYCWRLSNTKVTPLASLSIWERWSAHVIHSLFYLVIFGMCISGWVMATASGKPPSFWGHTLPAPGISLNSAIDNWGWTAHSTLTWVLIGLFALHVLAVLKHQFCDRSNVLRRMWPE
jgi:cytochrome b561